MNSRFSEKIALIAGGTGALGRAVTLAFIREGAKAVVTYRDEKELAELMRLAGSSASAVQGQHADVTDTTAVEGLIAGIVGEHGRLDIVVNTVGGYAGGLKLWETDKRTFELMLGLNLKSGFALARAAVPVMLQQKQGVIITIAAKAAIDHAAGAAAYAASKAAAVAMIDCLAADLKGTGVRANSVLPSIIDTEANRRAMPDVDPSNWPKPEDIAKVILFLCSDEGKLVHGASVPVYGAL